MVDRLIDEEDEEAVFMIIMCELLIGPQGVQIVVHCQKQQQQQKNPAQKRRENAGLHRTLSSDRINVCSTA